MASLKECAKSLGFEQFVEKPSGLVIAVMAVPTQSVDGLDAVGGVGESFISQEVKNIFGDMEIKVLTAGQSMREMVTDYYKHIYPNAELENGKLPEYIFESVRKSLQEKGELDKLLDDSMQQYTVQAIEAGQQVVIVEAKLAGQLIFENYQQLFPENKPALFLVGVDADDNVATQRFIARQHKHNPNQAIDFQTAQNRRISRAVMDNITYRSAHNILNYSREWILNRIHILIDNSQDMTEQDQKKDFRKQIARSILDYLDFNFSKDNLMLLTPLLETLIMTAESN